MNGNLFGALAAAVLVFTVSLPFWAFELVFGPRASDPCARAEWHIARMADRDAESLSASEAENLAESYRKHYRCQGEAAEARADIRIFRGEQ